MNWIDLISFALGFIVRGIAAGVATKIIIQPASRFLIRWIKKHPAHLQYLVHYYNNHNGHPRICLADKCLDLRRV